MHSLFGARLKVLRILEECDSRASFLRAVESGGMIGVCATAQLAGSRVAFVPFAPVPPPVEVGISYLKPKLTSPLVRQFVEAAREAAPPAGSRQIELKSKKRSSARAKAG